MTGLGLPEKILHGGDYNPDQWLDNPEILEEDIRLMKGAGINCVSLGIFAWSRLEPKEGVYDFDWLEKIIDRLYEEGIYTILATPTAARPRWLASKYEETRQMLEDGTRKLPGGRHNFCPSSPVMREKMRAIDTELAKRFGNKEAVIAWHISNEFTGGGGDKGDGACYCPYCVNNFRKYVKDKYKTLKNLNKAYWADFWSANYSDWEEINPPTEYGDAPVLALVLDWKRFTSDITLDFYKEEVKCVKPYGNKPCTANLMDFYQVLDYYKWGKELDFVAYDGYPHWHSQEDETDVAVNAAANHVMMRSMKKKPFILMESVTSYTAWRPVNYLKRPGMHMLSSLQAVANGSDSVMYFQMRKGRGSVEKYHGALIDHKNGGNTRVYKDVADLGSRLEKIAEDVLGSCNKPKIALIFDWENWWAVNSSRNMVNPFDYRERWLPYFKAFWELGVDVDIVNMDDPLDDYDMVVAPINYMYRADYENNVRRFVKGGGTYVTTYYSGEVDESDLVFMDMHPLSDVLGIRPEEYDVRPPYQENYIYYKNKKYPIKDFCQIVHAECAETLATYTDDFYAGMPALTHSNFGKGESYFIAAESDETFIEDLMMDILENKAYYKPLLATKVHGVTVSMREKEDGSRLYFVQNFNRTREELRVNKKMLENASGRKPVDLESMQLIGEILPMEPYECKLIKM